MRGMEDEELSSRVFNELCSLILSVIGSPPPSLLLPFFSNSPPSMPSSSNRGMALRKDISPAGFASLLLGVSLALMLCGSVTFVIGFMLMPWVFGLVVFFSFVGLVSNLSGFGRAIFSPPKQNDMPYKAWKCQ